jgi:two-component system sensor histidine kinase KdpD
VQEAAKRAATNALLYDLSSALLAGDLDTLLHTLVARLGETFALRACTVLLTDPDGELRSRANWGMPPTDAEQQQRATAAARWAAAQGKPVQLTIGAGDQADDAATPSIQPDASTAEETVLFLPLRSGIASPALGVLALTRGGRAAVGDEELHLLGSVAAQAALAVERARLVEESAAAAVLRESDRAKSALLANVSHDLRTPLTTIRGAAESLLQADLTFDGVTRVELLISIRDEADRLSALVGNLLNLSRLEAGALQPDRHLYDLAEIAGGVIARMRPQLAGHQVRTAFDPVTPLVSVDYTLIEQVVGNLLSNAAKFAPEGTTITVSIVAEAGQVLLSVQDQGPGIPPAARAQVFERFYRVPDAQSRRVAGTGLGLAICRAVAVAHGGRIWIDDADGGATVRLALPIQAAYVEDPGPVQVGSSI